MNTVDTQNLSLLFVAVVLGYVCLVLLGNATALTGVAATISLTSALLTGAASWYMQIAWASVDAKPTE